MRVEGVLSFAEYWADPRFRSKVPQMDGALSDRNGDNCYEPVGGETFRQLPSAHYDRDRENLESKAHDLGGERVLVSQRFAYFGANALPVPEHLTFMMPGRFYRTRFTDEQKRLILDFIEGLPRGIHGAPGTWKSTDDGSWQQKSTT